MTWEAVAAVAGRVIEAWAFRIALGVFIALATWRAASWARSSFERRVARSGADSNTRLLAGRLVYGSVWALGLAWVVGLIGVDQAGILATFGAVGLALGLAVQDIVKSFFAGLYLLFERPFLIGDEIQVKEFVGRVESVGFRATTIRTEDNVLVVIPNVVIFSEMVSNRAFRTEIPKSKVQPADPELVEGQAHHEGRSP